MDNLNDLLDLETFVEVKKAAPVITTVPFDIAKQVVQSMAMLSNAEDKHVDQNDHTYWQASIKDLHKLSGFSESTSFYRVGRACRGMGLTAMRKSDGFYVAWSADQLEILEKHFKLSK